MFQINPYQKKYRQQIRQIAWDTALRGESAGKFFSNKEVFTDFLTAYFTDFEPDSCFVAEIDSQVVGYIIGSKNEKQMEKIFKHKLFFKLLFKALFQGVFFSFKNLKFFISCFNSFIKGEFNDPSFYKDYPAVLHINLKDGFRHLGIGSKLISHYLNYLKKMNIKGVHLATMSDTAGAFFKKNGFELKYQTKRSYLKFVLKKDVNVYIFTKSVI